MQLSDIRTEVRYRVGVDDQDNMVTDAVLTSFINASIREIANMRDWSWHEEMTTYTIAAGANQTAVDSAFVRNYKRVYHQDDKSPLKQVSSAFGGPYQDYSGRPQFWWVEDNLLNIAPTWGAGGTIVAIYTETETTLSDDADAPLIPDYAIDLVVIKAALKVAARLDNSSQMQLLEREERDVIQSLEDDARRAKGPIITNHRRDWWIG